LSSIPRHDWQERIALEVVPFDVVNQMKYPEEIELKQGRWDAIMITGSSEYFITNLDLRRGFALKNQNKQSFSEALDFWN